MVARFSFTTRKAGMSPSSPSATRTSGQTAAAIASASRSTMRLAALIVTETWPDLTNTHSAVPRDHADEPGLARIGHGAEMDVEDRLERVRHGEVRQ